jgi:hypothetical protein
MKREGGGGQKNKGRGKLGIEKVKGVNI